MKKTLLLTLVFLVAVAQATSLKWNGNKATSAFTGPTGTALTAGAGSETASISVYYILYSNWDAVTSLGNSATAADIESYVVATAAGNSTSDKASGRVGTSSSTTKFTDSGVSFFARAYATIGEKSYFMNVFGGNGTDGVWTTTVSGDEATPENLAWKDGTYGGSVSTSATSRNSWVAVPEPSTAMLALAGLALLIKRRRA